MLQYCLASPNGQRNMFCAAAYEQCLKDGGSFGGLPYGATPWASSEFTPYPELFGSGVALEGQ